MHKKRVGQGLESCPFHMKNDTRRCRKFISLQERDGQTAESERRCPTRLKYWAVCHSSYSRQRRHVLIHPEFDECPDTEVLELMKGNPSDRPAMVLTDAALDAAEQTA